MTVPRFGFKRIDLILVVISAIMAFVIGNLPFKAKPLGDITFHEEAKNLALFLKGDVPYQAVVITKAPGPVFLYTIAYVWAPAQATDNQLWCYGIVLTSVLIAASLMLLYRAATNLFSREIALLTLLLAFIFPIHSYYTMGILAEAPAFFSTALAIYGWSRIVAHRQKFSGWACFTLGVWLLVLNRPNAILLPMLGFLVLAYAFWRQREFFKRYGIPLASALSLTILLGFGTLELAKAITKGKTDQDQSWYFYYVAHQGRFEFREEPTDLRFWENSIRPDSKDYINWVKSGHELNQKAAESGVPRNEVYRDFLIDDALAHPFWFLRSFAVKCVYGNLYFINSIAPDQFKLGPLKGAGGYWTLMAIVNLVNVFVIFGAILFLLSGKDLLICWPLWASILALLLFHGITYMEPRYIFPSRAGLYILSAAGLYRFGWIRRITQWTGGFAFPKS